MSADLGHSARLAQAGWFEGLVVAAMVEHALSLPNDNLSKYLVMDPSNLAPVFVRIVADNPAISDPAWDSADEAQQQSDIRFAVASWWEQLKPAISGLPA
jgi:hypothetical protein